MTCQTLSYRCTSQRNSHPLYFSSLCFRTYFSFAQNKKDFLSSSCSLFTQNFKWIWYKVWLLAYRYFIGSVSYAITSKLLQLQFSHSVMSDSLRSHELQHTRPPCPSPTPGVHPNPCPLSPWCHPTISSSVVPCSSCPQSFPASGLFKWVSSHHVAKVGVSASTSVFPMNTQDWSPLGCTGWISLQSKGLSRVFSNTTVQKHQFIGQIIIWY